MKNFLARIEDQDIDYSIEKSGGNQLKIQRDCSEKVFTFTLLSHNHFVLNEDGRVYEAFVHEEVGECVVWVNGETLSFRLDDEQTLRRPQAARHHAMSSGIVVAPMPGKVVRVLVSVGDEVTVHQDLMVVEAMKMENVFKSPCAGLVRRVAVAAGDSVEGHAVLVEITERVVK